MSSIESSATEARVPCIERSMKELCIWRSAQALRIVQVYMPEVCQSQLDWRSRSIYRDLEVP